MSDVTRLLDAASADDPRAAAGLLPLVYDELRALAAAQMAREKPGQTLDATALVHEAYLRLVGDQHFENTRHFFAAAAEAMRRIALMDHPNIARVLDAGTTDTGRPFFVMELVKGVAITEYCDANQLTPRQRLELFVSVCQAVQHHPDTLEATRRLAFLYWHQRKLEECERLLEQVLQGRRIAQGERHSDMLLTMGYLAVVSSVRGRHDRAEVLATQGLEQAEGTLGMDHLLTNYARLSLAHVYNNQKKFPPAEALFLRVIEAERRLLGDQHPNTLADIRSLALEYELRGRYAEAAPLITEALEGQSKVYGAKDSRVASVLAMLGHNLLQQQKHAETEQALRECLAIREEIRPDSQPFFYAQFSYAQSMLGGS